jgi:hypothetical protein
VERSASPALAEPVVLSKAHARPAPREDPPTSPDGADHESLAVFTPPMRDLSTPFGELGLAVLSSPEESAGVRLGATTYGVGITSTLSTRRPSMSTTSKECPSHSKRSPSSGTRPRASITMPPTVW